MTIPEQQAIIEEYRSTLINKDFPCIGARAALSQGNITCMVAGHMGCPADDRSILQFLYDFIDAYRSKGTLFHSAAVLFDGPVTDSDEMFDSLMWQRLQALSDLDAAHFGYDPRVDADPLSPNFSFSLKAEAMFIIGLHPGSQRGARHFSHPVLAFNPHAQFENLRETGRYERLKGVIRRRDIAFSGSANPMLDDFGQSSEIYQYSGRIYDEDWQCPLNIRHGKANYHPPA
ncbi:MAG: guanitoxin biosynthesis heme-dependent pre-guanitoxin N-hydroxylase GntA [Bacteroidota bacterium]|nr:guanitoxin biosynthesis heme-dependent pre-guanitoxin N-hydroxylase GntA [Bacteroidota bacterium]MDP4218023.1 guanitoxin biosynthesis heme-dependent pre-guanitoxin N-hydroxylase GntA [Bacteroidota bacterium]MDP4247659.1 guanitoxin biosynthesis heme-dependent pre-guanitoxin N-hydroxylase GntA [Bacteroidota bacterium]MDP4256873.1 guanitoxin biosynthesis heme-dependent pre-guanitoxin N-hydroxylase GntA [Bacteroidota bacterium]